MPPSPLPGQHSSTFGNTLLTGSRSFARLVASILAGIRCLHIKDRGRIAALVLGSLIAASSPTAVAQTESVLLSFGGTSGSSPYFGNLIQASDGSFYGTTQLGGGGGCVGGTCGTVYKVSPTGNFTLLHAFSNALSDGANPYSGVIQGTDGDFYGMTCYGGANNTGVIYKVTASGVFTLLHSFASATDGGKPSSNLVQGTDGNFYGTAQLGGANNDGTIFEMTPGGVFTVLHSFAGTDGAAPSAALVQATDGNFYGTTVEYGTGCAPAPSGCGTIFKITSGGTFTLLHSLSGSTDGKFPNTALIEGADGNFYGTSYTGGVNNQGTLYRISPSGTYALLHSFSGTASDGNGPLGGLVLGSDGNFYGTASATGTKFNGTVFSIGTSGAFTLLHSFTGAPSDGNFPNAGVVQGADGNFYGTTYEGGANGGAATGIGTVYKLIPASALAAPVALSASISQVSPGQSFTLTYAVSNATSATMQQCFATNTAGDTTGWIGIKTASTTSTAASLTASSTAGTYTYTLTCGGIESSQINIVVNGNTVAPVVAVSAVNTPFGSTTPVTVTATESGSSGAVTGGVVTFSVLSPATGSFSPATCTLSSAGTCTTSYVPTGTLAAGTYSNDIQASFAAVGGYSAATANNTLTVSAQVTPTVAVTAVTAPFGSTTPVTVIATESGTAGSADGSVVSFSVSGGANGGFSPATCTIASGSCKVQYIPTGSLAVGTYPGAIFAAFSAVGSYSGGSIANMLTIAGGSPQTITFPQPAQPPYVATTFPLSATATSGQPVTYTIVSGPATISGSLISYTGPGAIVVEADQPGNSSYAPAPPVQITIVALFLTEPVGTKSPEIYTYLTVTTSGTIGSTAILTQGAPNLDFNDPPAGICIVGATFTAGQTCSINFTFKPTLPGARYGGITLTSTTGTLLASSHIYGIGTGPQVTWNPGIETSLVSGISVGLGSAVDGSGNVFVADYANSLVKEVFAAGGYTNSITLPVPPSSFNGPCGLAIDGNGNIFVADENNSAVKEILAVGGYSTVNTIGSGFSFPDGVAVDSNGNVFVADQGSDTVKEALVADGYKTVQVISNVSEPWGLALDSSNNVFVVQAGNNPIKEIVAASGYKTVISIAGNGGFNSGAIAIDAAGNLFVGDYYQSVANGTLIEILAAGGYTNYKTLLSGVDDYFSLALDGSGNVFFTDSNFGLRKLDLSDPPILNFATTAIGAISTDSPKTITFANDGNEPLILAVPTSGNNASITPGFLNVTTSPGNCPELNSASSPASLAPGASCSYSISFSPIAPGLDSGFLIPTDNNLNVVNATQQVPLNGTGTGNTVTPIVTVSAVTAPFGSTTPVTVEASESGAAGSAVGGVVTFSVVSPATGSFNPATCMLLASSNSSTGVCATSYVPTGTLAVGTYANDISASFSAIGSYGLATATSNLTITGASGALQTINFPAPAGTQYAGTSVILTASASSGLAVTYTVVSGPAYLTGSTLTYTAAGTVVVEADQAGSATYAPAPSVQVTLLPILLTEPVGTSSVVIQTILTFTTAGTFANLRVLTQGVANQDFLVATGGTVNGGLCAMGAAYTAGQTCRLGFLFDPSRPGLRSGGITISDASGNNLASSFIYGMGIGPLVTYSPGKQGSVGSGLDEPTGVAVDGHGNIFVSGYGLVGVQEISPAGVITTIGQFDTVDDVAIDGQGNLFVAADRTNVSEVLAVNGTIPANPTIVPLATSFVSLNGIKVDANGNVFLANGDSSGATGAIYEIPAINGTFPATPTIHTVYAFQGGPTGVAIDAAGDVFYSDGVSNSVNEILAVNGLIPASPTVRTLGSGFGQLANVALDDADDVFTVDYTNHAVWELLAVNGSVPATNPTILKLGTGFSVPSGVFIDGAGTVYVADETIADVVTIDTIDPPVLNFATTYVGLTSADSPKTVTVRNDGNAPLVYTIPGSGPNPTITPGFTLGSSSTCPQLTAGSAGATLAAGSSCTNVVSFTPIAVGLDSGKLVTTDNNLNVPAATQTVLLNGTGKVQPPASITLTGSPNPVFLYNPITLTATVSSAVGTPTGTVEFLDGTSPLGTFPLNGSVATLVTSTLALGTHNITAIYSGDSIFATQTSSILVVLVEDFSFVITNPTLTIKHGGTGVLNFVVTTVGGTYMASDIGFTIVGSPDHSPVTFSPSTVVTGSGTTTGTITIMTPDYPVGPWSSIAGPRVVLALTLFGVVLLPFGRRRRQTNKRIANLGRLLLFLAALTSLTTFTGCADTWGPQHYPITVTATSGALSHTQKATLTSQP
jgi:uncharacterized repeat protein (TIGR03803 family)